MSYSIWEKFEEIFPLVADLPENEREAYLRELCAGDEELRREILALLKADEKAGQFIESPIALPDSLSQVFREVPTEKLITTVRVGSKFGAYRVLGKLGAGGMGAVYLAERADGEFRKKAAIKLVKNGADTDFNLRRFRHERQILAQLEHPNIARLLDGGTTEDGSPYLVMEYVEGKTLFDFCNSREMSLPERLNLFRQICQAVEYAHKNGVIHRDIKPGNILVNENGTVKLLDFGIAKILHGDFIGDSTEQTATMMQQMTPEYASPEQIKSEAITPASDVYSLGVCLYELLTGERPYKFPSRAPHEIARVICEQAVRAPQIVGETALAEDLQYIVLKALQKKPPDRYAAVADFDDDIKKFLAEEPVQKTNFQLESAIYSVSAWKTLDAAAREAYRRGRAAAYAYTFEGIAASEKFFQEAIAHDLDFAPAYSGLADFYNWQTIAGIVPPAMVQPAAREAAQKAIELDPDSSEAHASLAFATWAFNWNFEEAERLYRRAIALDPKNAKAREWLSYLLSSAGRHGEAIAEMQRAVRLDQDSPTTLAMFGLCLYYARRYGEAYEKVKLALALDPNYYLALLALSWVCPPLGKFDDAVEGARRAVEISDELTFNKFSLALALIADGQREEAREIALELEKRRRERFAPAYFLSSIYANLGETDAAFRWLDEAIKERGYWSLWLNIEPRFDSLRADSRFAERFAQIKLLSGDNPAITDNATATQTGEIETPGKNKASGKLKIKAAILSIFAALILVAVFAATNSRFFEKRTPAKNPQTPIVTQNEHASSETPLTNNAVVNGLYLAGKQQLKSSFKDSNDKAIEFFTEAIKLDPDFAHAYSGLADAYIQSGRTIGVQSEAAYRKAEEYAVKALALNPDLAEARISLGMAVYKNTKNFEQAEKHFRRAIDINPSLSEAHHSYGIILVENGCVKDAIREIKIAAELEPNSASINYTLGAVLFNEKRFADAIPHFDRAIKNSEDFAAAYGSKAVAQQILGDYDGALETYRSVRIINGDDEDEPTWLLMQAQAHAGMGRREQSLVALNRFFQTPEYRKDPLLHLFNTALVYNLLGDTDKAFAFLEKIKGKSSVLIYSLSQDPRLANLHGAPRFKRLIEKWKKQADQNANKK